MPEEIAAWLTPQGWFLLIAFFFGSIMASYKFQYQSLFYILVVAYAAFTLPSFIVITLWYLVILIVSGAIRTAAKP